jgi:hypothetical protein
VEEPNIVSRLVGMVKVIAGSVWGTDPCRFGASLGVARFAVGEAIAWKTLRVDRDGAVAGGMKIGELSHVLPGGTTAVKGKDYGVRAVMSAFLIQGWI